MNVRVNIEQFDQRASAPAWRDRKKAGWLLSPSLPVLAMGITGLVAGQGVRWRTGYAWAGPVLIHVLIPLFDRLLGEDQANPDAAAMQQLANDRYYDRIVRVFIPLQYAALFTLAGRYRHADVGWFGRLGLALTAGAVSGIAINTAHELGHRAGRLERTLARMALAPSAYGHFAVEHNFGHHRRVATPEDPASSRLGESFWQFLPRTVSGSLLSAISIEQVRLARRGLSFWSWRNELLQGWAMSGLTHGALLACFGRKIVPFIGIQAAYGFSLLEVVNYIEHYGLLRGRDAQGRYERVQPAHSWNSNYLVTNLFLYQLQRHADHHAHPTRPYQLLRHLEGAPQLPGGYASMILPAYIPGWWSRIMDQRVIRHYAGNLDRINRQPAQARPWRDGIDTLKQAVSRLWRSR